VIWKGEHRCISMACVVDDLTDALGGTVYGTENMNVSVASIVMVEIEVDSNSILDVEMRLSQLKNYACQ
jgi:hypothetical protein